ncbi:hypothetical protein L917_19496 [Phytophthora nicotianae]|uniref:Uncharacterized protein n=2 Tax=Phytophthora nicotianae TaxID=4792 RepID=W2K6B4_PHYNI|nr:hypothetical protein L917_19496 [Phytophthora nicotianae]
MAKTQRALRNDKTTVQPKDGTLNEEQEERAPLSLPKLSKLFQRNAKSMPNLPVQRNPTPVEELKRLKNNPAVLKEIKSVKENPEMMKRVNSLRNDPKFIKSLEKPPSLKPIKEAQTYLSRGLSEEVSEKLSVYLFFFGFFGFVGAFFGAYFLLNKINPPDE